jgi:hypothetical protein
MSEQLRPGKGSPIGAMAPSTTEERVNHAARMGRARHIAGVNTLNDWHAEELTASSPPPPCTLYGDGRSLRSPRNGYP